MSRAMASVSVVLLVAGVTVRVIGAADQTTGPPRPSLLIASMYGADLYRHYCAPCHGRDGRGHGPAVAALKAPPPDLTMLARRSDGVFPREAIAALVHAGGTAPVSPAHGSREMPIWGPIFRALDNSDTQADLRVTNLVDYLASLQVK